MPAFANQLQLLEPVRLDHASSNKSLDNNAINTSSQNELILDSSGGLDQVSCLHNLSLPLQDGSLNTQNQSECEFFSQY